MEDDQEEDRELNDLQMIKRKKSRTLFENNSQKQYKNPKRSLSLSLKSTRSKKKACTPCSIKTFLEKNQLNGTEGKDQLKFCPVCQLPFCILIGLSVEGHVQECVATFSESSVLCPNGVNCNSVDPHHFKKYSHQQLASLRSHEIKKSSTCDEETEHNKMKQVEFFSKTDVKSRLFNNSKDTNLLNLKTSATNSSAKTSATNSSASLCIDNSVNIVNSSENVEEPLPTLENILDKKCMVETSQSSEKENLGDVNEWLNDSLEYVNFEMFGSETECVSILASPTNFIDTMNPAKFDVNIKNVETVVETHSDVVNTKTVTSETATSARIILSAETTVAKILDVADSRSGKTSNVETNVATTSETAKSIGIISDTENVTSDTNSKCYSTKSIEEKLSYNKSPRTQKHLIMPRKQMDIGVYFGLKPKQKVADVSAKVLQQKEVHKEQLQTQCSDGKATPKTKKCPFYKIVEGTSFAVDAFSFGHIPGISAYFLSHFHYDHYGGLKRSFSKPIYCSQITANLIALKIKVAARFIHPLPLYTPTIIENIEVTLLEANHCPGAVMFIFKLPNGQTHLHTGDFRASTAMHEIPAINRSSIHTLYLDTTYSDPTYSFPPQSETVEFCVSTATEAVTRNAKTLIVVGTYTIGKEKIFIAVANALQCKVAVQRDKYNVLQCLESEQLKKIITQDYKEAKVHVLPMAHLVHKKLAAHLNAYGSRYSELLAFKPTGWTFTDCAAHDLKNIKPSKRASVTIYGVPYSEHSSFKELKQFVQFIKPHKIIPTVNNGSAKKREEMKNIFTTWLRN